MRALLLLLRLLFISCSAAVLAEKTTIDESVIFCEMNGLPTMGASGDVTYSNCTPQLYQQLMQAVLTAQQQTQPLQQASAYPEISDIAPYCEVKPTASIQPLQSLETPSGLSSPVGLPMDLTIGSQATFPIAPAAPAASAAAPLLPAVSAPLLDYSALFNAALLTQTPTPLLPNLPLLPDPTTSGNPVQLVMMSYYNTLATLLGYPLPNPAMTPFLVDPQMPRLSPEVIPVAAVEVSPPTKKRKVDAPLGIVAPMPPGSPMQEKRTRTETPPLRQMERMVPRGVVPPSSISENDDLPGQLKMHRQ